MFRFPLDSRVSLWPPYAAEAATLSQVVAANEAHLAPWLATVLELGHSVEAARAWLAARAVEVARDEGLTAVIRIEEEALAGLIWTSKLTWTHRKCQLHFWLAAQACGQGVMTRSLAAVLAYLFEQRKLHRATVRVRTGHPRVGPLLERLGFSHEGVIRESVWLGDAPYDDDLFGLLAREFRPEAATPTPHEG